MKKLLILGAILSLSFFAPFSLSAFQIAMTEIRESTHPLYPMASSNKEGYLAVSEKHRLFYATYGNPEGTPIVILHGGPGCGCDDVLSRFFDLSFWHVIMFDQRGAMRSTPLGCMEENTPQNSIADIEALRKHLGITQWVVFGGSWGSTLGLLYGQAHPERCLGFILRGIFLAREQDYLHLLYGMGKIFPEAYEPFLYYIPEEERDDLLLAYYKRVMDPNPEIHLPAAKAFMQYDLICSTLLPNKESVEKVIGNDLLILSIARAFLYYSYHKFFLEPNQILSNMEKIAHLPSVIIHGRWDAICLPQMAYVLHQKWNNSVLWFVPDGGHSANESAISQALANTADLFKEKFKHDSDDKILSEERIGAH